MRWGRGQAHRHRQDTGGATSSSPQLSYVELLEQVPATTIHTMLTPIPGTEGSHARGKGIQRLVAEFLLDQVTRMPHATELLQTQVAVVLGATVHFGYGRRAGNR